MAKEFVYLKLTEEATVYSDPASGVKLVRDVPAKMTRKAFEQARNNKSSDFKDRFGSHFVQCNEEEYNLLIAARDKNNKDNEKAIVKSLKANIDKLNQKFGKDAVTAAVAGIIPKTEEAPVSTKAADEDEDEEDENEEDDGTFEGISKNKIIDWMIENDDETEESDRKDLKKNNRDVLVQMAQEAEAGLE